MDWSACKFSVMKTNQKGVFQGGECRRAIEEAMSCSVSRHRFRVFLQEGSTWIFGFPFTAILGTIKVFLSNPTQIEAWGSLASMITFTSPNPITLAKDSRFSSILTRTLQYWDALNKCFTISESLWPALTSTYNLIRLKPSSFLHKTQECVRKPIKSKRSK